MMRKRVRLLLLMSSATLLTACGDKVDEAAAEACECLKPIYAQMDEMSKAMQSGDMAKLSAMTANMDAAQKTQSCLEKVGRDYPEIGEDRESQDRFNARLGELCPAPRMMGM